MSGGAGAADLVLGVDLGTTSTKVVAFDTAGTLVASASHGYPLEEPHPGHAVQDPDLILAAVHAALRDVVMEVGAERVAALSFSSAMHSVLGLSPTLEPLTEVVTWGDTRAAAQAERLRSAPGGLALHRRTGTPLHPMSPLPKIVWFHEQEPKLCERVGFWVGIKEYVLLRLCGALVVDHSIASATGLMEMATLAWDAEALALAGITAEQLPEIVPTTHVLTGLTEAGAAATGLPADTRVVVGAADGPLANLGVGAVRPGVAACSLGTSGALRVVVDRPAVDPLGGVFCYALTPTRWVVGGAINNGGVVMGWARDTLAPDADDETELLALAEGVPVGAGGLLMLPYLLSERAPHWSSLPKGVFVGLTRSHGREHLVRAAVEGVCLQLATVLDAMRAAGFEVSEVRATGGVMRSGLWRQTLADAFGMDVQLAEGQEGSGFGAALLGMEAIGLVESIDVVADMVEVTTTVRPRPAAAAVYRSLLPVFTGLYDALVPTFTSLRRLAPSLPLEADGS
ncbi:gluconokinase [Cellulomonas marina]|uniref:Gluconokinase n=1 Tax=Cellulomonas marina TaxID=988821 RepID=A0A1I0Z1B0_9CELL|nr:gluconokinase [Cellulomonas marina]GIG28174.1 gluconate kinase [Cellulomonas marina]SFB19415.1 gluconokinase [Cellulomonas marina]